MNSQNPTQIHATGEATGFIPAPGDSEVARLKARFVIKDADTSLKGAA